MLRKQTGHNNEEELTWVELKKGKGRVEDCLRWRRGQTPDATWLTPPSSSSSPSSSPESLGLGQESGLGSRFQQKAYSNIRGPIWIWKSIFGCMSTHPNTRKQKPRGISGYPSLYLNTRHKACSRGIRIHTQRIHRVSEYMAQNSKGVFEYHAWYSDICIFSKGGIRITP